jgi:Family of unknown function (DUF6498)
LNLFLRALQALGLNAVPAGGFFLGTWSWDTALTLYWFENLLGGLFIGLRIALHRRWTDKRGHFRAHSLGMAQAAPQENKPRREPGSLLSSFLVPTVVFTLAHGLFLGFALRNLLPHAGSGTAVAPLRWGALALGCLLAIGFAIDLTSLRARPFAWLREMAELHLGRVVLVQLAILVGFVLMAWRGHEPQRFLLAFAALKTLADIGNLSARALGVQRLDIATPSPWFAGMMNRLGKKSHGEDFETYWQRLREQQQELEEEDEWMRNATAAPAARRNPGGRR